MEIPRDKILDLVREHGKSSPARPGRRITLHECRHTFASMLMAAGYTIKEIMVFMATPTSRRSSATSSSSRNATNATLSTDSTPTSAPRLVRGEPSVCRPRSGRRSGHDRQPTCSRGQRTATEPCRRRDSNPRHADYDSAVPWLYGWVCGGWGTEKGTGMLRDDVARRALAGASTQNATRARQAGGGPRRAAAIGRLVFRD